MLSDAQIWQRWLEWIPTAPPVSGPGPAFNMYRTSLLAGGTAEAEADQQLAVILRMMATESEGWQALFNNIYSSGSTDFTTTPNALLMSAVDGHTPGRALDIGAGQGRNAVFLAIKGWDVTAVDISDEGLKVAERNAEQAGVKIQTVIQDNHSFDLGTSAWDLIVLTYVPVPVTSPEYAGRISAALRPHGLVVVESFGTDASATGRSPVNIDPARLQHAYADLHILRLEDTVARPDWTQEEVRLVRFIAEKRPISTDAA